MTQPHVIGGGLVNPRHHKTSPLILQAGTGHATAATLNSVAGQTGVVVLTAADFAAGTFPGDVVFTSGSTGSTQTALNSTTRIATTAFATTADNLKAALSGPTLTGTPSFPTGTTAVTQSAADGSTKLATTLYVDTADALKASLASPTITGTPSLPTGTTASTQSAADSSTKLATTAFVTTADNLKANLASPTFTGTVTVPNGVGATDLAAFSQIPVAGAVGGLSKLVFRTGDSTTVSNATLVSDDTLLWTVGANDIWWFQAYCTFTAANGAGTASAGDMKIGWSVPASGTMQWGWQGVSLNTTGAGYGWVGTATTPNTVRTVAQQATGGSDALTYGVLGSGYYTGGGTSGTVNFRYAQNATDASTLQINKNSLLMLWRLA